MMLNSKRNSVESLFLLICTGVLFIVLHIFHIFSRFLPDPGFSIENDRSFGEVFQYLKEYWIVLMFCWLSFVKSERSYLVWALFFGYLLIDDAFLLHEQLGAMVATYFGYRDMLRLRAVDLGELMVFAMSGIVFLTLLGAVYYWGSDDFRRTCKRLVMLLVLLAFFGVIVDMVHVMVIHPRLDRLLGMVEDGGEMLVISVICWYVLRLLKRARELSVAEAASTHVTAPSTGLGSAQS